MVETYPAYDTFPDYDGAPSGNISITSCLFALERAIELGWYDLDTFDVEFYEVCAALAPSCVATSSPLIPTSCRNTTT